MHYSCSPSPITLAHIIFLLKKISVTMANFGVLVSQVITVLSLHVKFSWNKITCLSHRPKYRENLINITGQKLSSGTNILSNFGMLIRK